MSEIHTVFLDLDSVLVAMNEGVCSHLNIPYTKDVPSDEEIYKLAGGRKNFWSWFGTHEFFSGLNPYPWAKDLVKMVDNTGIDWVFLSKSTINDGVSSGKSHWLRRNLPEYQDRLWLARGSKARASGLGKFLIDDKNINIEEWKAANGMGYLWKELHPSQTDKAQKRIEEIRKILTQ